MVAFGDNKVDGGAGHLRDDLNLHRFAGTVGHADNLPVNGKGDQRVCVGLDHIGGGPTYQHTIVHDQQVLRHFGVKG